MFPPSLKMLVAVCAAGAMSLVAQTTTTSATRQVTLPPIGLGSTETAKIIVLNAAASSSSTTTTTTSCTVSVSFLNAAGTTIGSATSLTLTPGQIGTSTLAFTASGLTAPRGIIRGQLSYTESSTNHCNLTYAIETYDTSSGASHLYVGGQAGSGLGR